MKYLEDDFKDYCDDIDVKKITHLYQMRHACNVIGFKDVSEGLGLSLGKIQSLYDSKISGSIELLPFLNSKDDEEFKKNLIEKKKEAKEKENKRLAAEEKNNFLVKDLHRQRNEFAGIGTNKAKRRLNKLAQSSVIAKAIRIALEIEDKSIQAKDSCWSYKDKIYRVKEELIEELAKLFKDQNWIYGIQKSDVKPTTHVVYFEIPDCEQISWHFTPNKISEFPVYSKDWDGKENSTFMKLEKMAKNILESLKGQ